MFTRQPGLGESCPAEDGDHTGGHDARAASKSLHNRGRPLDGLNRRFVSQDCSYFKVDVEFKAVGRADRNDDGRVTLLEDPRDIITKISRPYLQFDIVD